VQEKASATGQRSTTTALLLDLMTRVDGVTPIWSTTHDYGGPTTVTDYADGRHLSTADVETTGYLDDCDFRLVANRCWTGNGSSFDTLSASMAGAEVVAGSHNFWTLLLLVFPVLTVFGNVLVVLGVYHERSLQSATNYFIVSLAIADIMVAILVMPLAVYVEVRTLTGVDKGGQGTQAPPIAGPKKI